MVINHLRVLGWSSKYIFHQRIRPFPGFTQIGDVGLGDGTFGSLFFYGLTDGSQGDQEKATEIDIAGVTVGIFGWMVGMEGESGGGKGLRGAGSRFSSGLFERVESLQSAMALVLATKSSQSVRWSVDFWSGKNITEWFVQFGFFRTWIFKYLGTILISQNNKNTWQWVFPKIGGTPPNHPF